MPMEHAEAAVTGATWLSTLSSTNDDYGFIKNQSGIHITERVRPGFFLFAEVSAILCVIFGVIGNVLTIITIAYTKKIRDNSNNVFVCNMSISDCLFCAIVLPFTALKYHRRSWPLPDLFCEWLAFFKFAFTCMALLSLCIIAFNRYIYLIHSRLQSKIFKRRNVIILIASAWTLSILLTILPIVKVWGYYGFDPDVLACTFSRNSSSYRKFIVSLSLFVPFLFMIVCYSRICVKVFKVQRQMKRWSSRGSKHSQSSASRRENLQLTTTMILIFLLHGVSCLPYTCVGIFDPNVKYPVFHIITPPIAWLQFVLNPLVYTIVNLQFRKAYKVVILRAFCRDVKDTPLNEASFLRSGQNSGQINGLNSQARLSAKMNQEKPNDVLTFEFIDDSALNIAAIPFDATPKRTDQSKTYDFLLPNAVNNIHGEEM